MGMLRVQRRVRLEGSNEQVLDRRIDHFTEALRVRSGSIVALERPGVAGDRSVVMISYELPIEA